MAITFNDGPFITSHGRSPKGRGSWAFADCPDPDMNEVIFTPSMTYTEAKTWMRKHLKREYGIDARMEGVTVYVLP